MVETGGPQLDEDLARTRLRIGDLLVAQDVRTAVLVNPHGSHESESSHDCRRAEPLVQ
jgi:hypothetical protein